MRLYHFWFAAEWQKGFGRTLLLLSSSEKCSTAHARRKHLAQKLLQSESNLHNTERGNFGLICIAERHQKLTQSQGYASKADIDTKGVSL